MHLSSDVRPYKDEISLSFVKCKKIEVNEHHYSIKKVNVVENLKNTTLF